MWFIKGIRVSELRLIMIYKHYIKGLERSPKRQDPMRPHIPRKLVNNKLVNFNILTILSQQNIPMNIIHYRVSALLNKNKHNKTAIELLKT